MSEEALHWTVICVDELAIADTPLGIEGGVVSGGVGVPVPPPDPPEEPSAEAVVPLALSE